MGICEIKKKYGTNKFKEKKSYKIQEMKNNIYMIINLQKINPEDQKIIALLNKTIKDNLDYLKIDIPDNFLNNQKKYLGKNIQSSFVSR